jgi:hypothetical protein
LIVAENSQTLAQSQKVVAEKNRKRVRYFTSRYCTSLDNFVLGKVPNAFPKGNSHAFFCETY